MSETTHTVSASVTVVGAGAAGVSAAHILARAGWDVTLVEREDRLGGHAHTVAVPEGPDAGTPVDTGFIVCNDWTYPLFLALMDELDVPLGATDMSFSFHDRARGFYYSSVVPGGLFASPKNAFTPSFWRLVYDIPRFQRRVREDLAAGRLAGLTLGDYLAGFRAGGRLGPDHIAPMAAAIWSASAEGILDYPMESYARFFDNHGLLTLYDQPVWRFVKGGSASYVAAFRRGFSGRILTGRAVTALVREPEGVRVVLEDGASLKTDYCVVATHADQALALLGDPTPDERRLLGAWRYTSHQVVLHAQAQVLPPRRGAWACWNSEAAAPGRPPRLHYWMNRLQRLDAVEEHIVSLNPGPSVLEGARAVSLKSHPHYDDDAVASQDGLEELNARSGTEGRVRFCGSYFGYGFHEDAVRAGARAAAGLGAAWPPLQALEAGETGGAGA